MMSANDALVESGEGLGAEVAAVADDQFIRQISALAERLERRSQPTFVLESEVVNQKVASRAVMGWRVPSASAPWF
jgi:hypothetical protein